MASQKAAAWRRGWFSGLLPDGLRAPRTGQDGHKCHEENQRQGGEKKWEFLDCTPRSGMYLLVEPKVDFTEKTSSELFISDGL